MSDTECSKVQPLHVRELDRSVHSPSPEADGGVCRIEPLPPPETKKRSKRSRSKRSSEATSVSLDTYPEYDQTEASESVPQLEQQEFRPESKAAVSSTPLKGEDLKCTICGTQYQAHKVSYFKAHMLQHTCPICKTALPFHDLVNHVKLHLVNRSSEEGKLDIPCTLCRKRFKTLSNYDAHVSQVHRCPVCEKCFRRKEVIDHMRTHFGQDGTINLDNASTVQAIVDQGQGEGAVDEDEDEEHPVKKTGSSRKQASPCKSEKRKYDSDSDDDDDRDNEGSTPKNAKLIVKLKKALKRSRSKSLSEDDEEDDEEDDKDSTSIKEHNDDDDDNDKGASGMTEKKDSDSTQDGTNNQSNSSQNDQNNSQQTRIKKEPKDEEIELSGYNLEELDGETNEDSLYDDINDEDFVGGSSKKSVKLARARYIQEIGDRCAKVIKNNTCTMCGVSTQYPNRIRKHVRKAHYCTICDQFFEKENLAAHFKEHDAPGKEYVCQFCGEHCLSALKLHYHDCNFNKKTSLYYHCKICEEKFTSRDGLTMHLRTHDPTDFHGEWDKNMCQLCGFIFIGRSNLVRHMQSRACTHCGLQTVSSCQHQKHMLSNHHSSAYQCSSCEVQFLSQHSYVDHVTERQCSGCSEIIEPSCEYLKHESLCKTGRERNTEHLELLCLKCDSILTDTYVYDCHVRDHGKLPGKYYCKNCNTQFAQNREYGIHMSKRSCPQCGGKFQPMCKWNQHACFRMEPPSEKCPNCKKVFYRVLTYQKHCKILTCGKCPHLVFNSVCTINKHYESEHDGKNIIIEEPETPVSRGPKLKIKIEKTSDQEDFDEDDELSNSNKDSPVPHGASAVKLISNGCDFCEKFKQPMTMSRLRKHLNGAACHICKELVAPLCKYKKHYVQCAYNLAPTEANKDLLSNDGDGPAKCPLCGMRLLTINGLKSHLRVGNMECEECGEKFSAHCVFKKHQVKTRHGKKDNICPICSKGFQYSRDMKKHLLIHTGERPYECLMCGNSYRNPGHLSYHLKVQHGGARPYKCKYCQRGFGALSGCTKHEKRHEKKTKNKCQHCGMMFVAAHSLTKHLANRVCLMVEKDTPQMLPNLLEDQGFTMDFNHDATNNINHDSLPENNDDEDSEDMDFNDDNGDPDSESEPESDPGSDPDYSLQSSSSVPKEKKQKKKINCQPSPPENHKLEGLNHVNSLEKAPMIKEEPLSE